MARILVVDDEQSMRDFLAIFLRKQGFEVECSEDGGSALELLKQSSFDLVISDVKMSPMDGITLLKKAKKLYPRLEFLVMTAFSSTADAILAMKDGAYDYITKPFQLEKVKSIIERALENSRQSESGEKKEIQQGLDFSNIIGQSETMKPVFDRIAKVAKTKTTILIGGESGTGKELVARAVHNNSLRANKPFVSINCGAIPAELMESEMFGHSKGAFTGAVRDKDGLFTVAAEGTLFLDEISEMPMHLQVKLLRALQEKKIMPVGGTSELDVDTRVIAATNRNLSEEVKNGRFREDLYYRLNIIQIQIPPLRKRKDDIPLLIKHFVKRACKEMQKDEMQVSGAASMILMSYDYPGNVRELSNLIERAVALETTDQIRPDSLPGNILERYINDPEETSPSREVIDFSEPINLDQILADKELEIINQALEFTGGNKTEAAKLLGMTFRSLRYRLKKLGVDSEQE